MASRRPLPPWSRPPQHTWKLDEIKHGNVAATHSLNAAVDKNPRDAAAGRAGCCVTFGRIADDPSLIDVVTAHESCSRLHARIAFDGSGTPWLRDLGSGNGTFVNGRRLPPEACGRGEDSGGAMRGSRGVVLYPGDAIRFGASTRVFVLEGPEEFERGAVKLRRKVNKATAATESAPGNDGEAPSTEAKDDGGCSWGMSDNAIPTEDDDQEHPQNTDRDQSNLPPLPSMDTFFSGFSTKYKVPPSLQQLHNQYQSKSNKLQSIQTESGRITQKENMGVELTDGQRGQLARNQERITTLEREVANLKERIEDGMHVAIHGKERISKRPKGEDDRYAGEEYDVDDFYDRTASSSKRQRVSNTRAESEQSLTQKWKSLLVELAGRRRTAMRASERRAALRKQIDECEGGDDADVFFLKNDLALADDNLSKAKESLEETEGGLDQTEHLLRIVNPKLIWDREEGCIGCDIVVGRGEGAATAPEVPDAVDDSIMMPPPPAAVVEDAIASSAMLPPPPVTVPLSSMPPPPPVAVAVAPASEIVLPEHRRIPGPMRLSSTGSGDENSATTPSDDLGRDCMAEPQRRKKKQMGPMRPPVHVQGTLAALNQATSSQPTPNSGSVPHSLAASQSSGKYRAKSQTKVHGVSDAFDSRKDEWKAPADQDGSGRTSLHKKFKGRY